MPVKVEIPTPLRTYTGGQRSVEGNGADVAELLLDVDARHPGLRARLVADDGKLRRFIHIFINDGDIHAGGRTLDTKLAEGDVVTIIPAVAGGA